MKKIYEAPSIEIEKYELNSNIAANCSTVVNAGPGDANNPVCEDFEGITDIGLFAVARAGVTFYSDSCDCYYNASESPYFTS